MLATVLTFLFGCGVLLLAYMLMRHHINMDNQRLQLQKQQTQVNNDAALAELNAVLDERLKLFDKRINETWGKVSTTHEELVSLRLQLGLKGMTK